MVLELTHALQREPPRPNLSVQRAGAPVGSNKTGQPLCANGDCCRSVHTESKSCGRPRLAPRESAAKDRCRSSAIALKRSCQDDSRSPDAFDAPVVRIRPPPLGQRVRIRPAPISPADAHCILVGSNTTFLTSGANRRVTQKWTPYL